MWQDLTRTVCGWRLPSHRVVCVLYELTARNLYTYYEADIYAYVMVMQNINRELCRRLRRADNRIAELADASRESMTQNRVRPGQRKGVQ